METIRTPPPHTLGMLLARLRTYEPNVKKNGLEMPQDGWGAMQGMHACMRQFTFPKLVCTTSDSDSESHIMCVLVGGSGLCPALAGFPPVVCWGDNQQSWNRGYWQLGLGTLGLRYLGRQPAILESGLLAAGFRYFGA